jgi:hypothetical protein
MQEQQQQKEQEREQEGGAWLPGPCEFQDWPASAAFQQHCAAFSPFVARRVAYPNSFRPAHLLEHARHQEDGEEEAVEVEVACAQLGWSSAEMRRSRTACAWCVLCCAVMCCAVLCCDVLCLRNCTSMCVSVGQCVSDCAFAVGRGITLDPRICISQILINIIRY